jgi:RNA polymerase primary sigma factor
MSAITLNPGVIESLPIEEPMENLPHPGTLQIYLREIGPVKLLTRDEEVELAERVKRGDSEARERMIKANLRLVVKIARDYEGLGVPLLDLISEGNIGLMKGVERFQPGRGARLSTYVAWWIKQAIKLALANQSRIIRLPVHATHKVSQIRSAEINLRETLDRDATDTELAADLKIDPRRVRRYREASRVPISLDSPGDGEDAPSLAEAIADENVAAPFDRLVKNNDRAMMQELLATLDRREVQILRMRFGLGDREPMTLDAVADCFGLTRERIRQLQEHALDEIREKIELRDSARKRQTARPAALQEISRGGAIELPMAACA